VPSGVRSRGVTPVPPVVSTTRAPEATASAMAVRTGSAPSGTTTTLSTMTPWARRSSTASGPEASSRSPAAQRSETVMTAPLTGSSRG